MDNWINNKERTRATTATRNHKKRNWGGRDQVTSGQEIETST